VAFGDQRLVLINADYTTITQLLKEEHYGILSLLALFFKKKESHFFFLLCM
jgi:hypothetical protein